MPSMSYQERLDKMAQLRNLGTPFGSPGGIINIPAPAGSQLAGQIQMQSMAGLGQALGMYFGQKKAGQLKQEDIRRLQAMGPQQDILNTMYGAREMMAPQAQLPEMVSPMGQELALQGQLGSIFPSATQSLNRWRLNKLMNMSPEQQEQYLLKPPVSINMPTGQQLLDQDQRQEVADTEFSDKVGLSASEKNLARKSAEEILKGARKRFWHWGTEDYPHDQMTELYKTWRIENTYPEKTERQRKSLDNIWDGLMGLWKKRGHRFDRDTVLGKGEIEWDPKHPDIVNLRKGKKTEPVSKGSPFEHKTLLEGGSSQATIDSGIWTGSVKFDRYPIPKNETEFEETLSHIRPKENQPIYFETIIRKMAKTNPEMAQKYYDKYSDEIYK